MGERGRPVKYGGRPSILTDKIREDVVKLMRAGNYFETACSCAGVRPATARVWMVNGREQKRGKYRKFFEAVKEAEAFAEASAVSRIRQFGGKFWQAEAWFLERRMPAKWGRWERKADEVDGESRKLTLTEENMGGDNAADG